MHLQLTYPYKLRPHFFSPWGCTCYALVQRCICDKIFIKIRSVLSRELSQVVEIMPYLRTLKKQEESLKIPRWKWLAKCNPFFTVNLYVLLTFHSLLNDVWTKQTVWVMVYLAYVTIFTKTHEVVLRNRQTCWARFNVPPNTL